MCNQSFMLRICVSRYLIDIKISAVELAGCGPSMHLQHPITLELLLFVAADVLLKIKFDILLPKPSIESVPIYPHACLARKASIPRTHIIQKFRWFGLILFPRKLSGNGAKPFLTIKGIQARSLFVAATNYRMACMRVRFR